MSAVDLLVDVISRRVEARHRLSHEWGLAWAKAGRLPPPLPDLAAESRADLGVLLVTTAAVILGAGLSEAEAERMRADVERLFDAPVTNDEARGIMRDMLLRAVSARRSDHVRPVHA